MQPAAFDLVIRRRAGHRSGVQSSMRGRQRRHHRRAHRRDLRRAAHGHGSRSRRAAWGWCRRASSTCTRTRARPRLRPPRRPGRCAHLSRSTPRSIRWRRTSPRSCDARRGKVQLDRTLSTFRQPSLGARVRAFGGAAPCHAIFLYRPASRGTETVAGNAYGQAMLQLARPSD